MRVLIHFSQKKRNKHIFEGARVRKSLKGACELNKIAYTSDPKEPYDIAHFVSAKDENLINTAILKKVPVVISALMCENDPDAAMLVQKGEVPTLKPRALRVLNKVTLVLVPTESGRAILKHAGVETPVRVLSEGVNLARFDPSKDLEKQIFSHYYKLNKSKKLVVSTGEYGEDAGLADLIAIARKRPDAEFFYFGSKKGLLLPGKIRRVIAKAPKNCHFEGIVEDDVYRSALMNASAYLIVGYTKAGTVTILDAMAARTQIIAREDAIYADMLVNKREAYVCKTTAELDKKVGAWLDGNLEATIEGAYLMAKSVDLKKIGASLKDIYDSLYYFGGLR